MPSKALLTVSVSRAATTNRWTIAGSLVWNFSSPYSDYNSRNSNSTSHRSPYNAATCLGVNSSGRFVTYR